MISFSIFLIHICMYIYIHIYGYPPTASPRFCTTSFLMDGGDVEKRTDYLVWTDWLNGALQEKRQQRTGSAGREFSSFIFHSSI